MDEDDALEPDARDERHAAARLLETMERDVQVAQLREMLQDERLRDFLWRVLGWCNIYSTTYQKNFGDMALLEGKRQLGLKLLNEICEASPDAEMLMRQKAIAVGFAQAQKERSARQRPRPP